MPVYTIQLLEKKEIAKDTQVFIFSKPDQFTFIPGQYAGFTLPGLLKTHPTASTKRFSLLSTPSDKHISIATRMQPSLYKENLMNLSIGSEIKMAGPSGNFVLHQDLSAVPAVLLAGGIGITPFYSMIKSLSFSDLIPIHLFYANRTPDEAAFLNELFALEKQNAAFKFIPTMTAPTSEWQGERGYISDTLIKKYLSDDPSSLSKSIFYVCGSPHMVEATQEILLNDLVIPVENIKLEDFPGYLEQ
jgi:ferredoxin-NADP reductase